LSAGLLYLDSSAIVKLVARELESGVLFKFAGAWPDRVSSQLARIEVSRVLRRANVGQALFRRAEETLARMLLLRIDEEVIRAASEIAPAELRCLNAIHLATAVSLGTQLGLFVAYDRRLIEAADRAGLSTASPT